MLRRVVLAGGTASRLYPLTKITNKCFNPIQSANDLISSPDPG